MICQRTRTNGKSKLIEKLLNLSYYRRKSRTFEVWMIDLEEQDVRIGKYVSMSAENTIEDLKCLLGKLLPDVGQTHESALVHLAEILEDSRLKKQQLLQQCQAEEEAQAVQSISVPGGCNSNEEKVADCEVQNLETAEQEEEEKSETKLSESRKKLNDAEDEERSLFLNICKFKNNLIISNCEHSRDENATQCSHL